MAIKESSDELNPTLVAPAGVVEPPPPANKAADYFALAIATCGVGYIPLAPGTFGSLVGVGLFFLVRALFLRLLESLIGRDQLNLLYIHYALLGVHLLTLVLVTLAGSWAASRVERQHGIKDPAKVVIDEVAGQYLALIAVPLAFISGWTIVAAFVFFRFFDIVKPYPARKFESLHGGTGIIADDLVAGVYAAIVVTVGGLIMWLI